jgi:Tol biopolymer transport system component
MNHDLPPGFVRRMHALHSFLIAFLLVLGLFGPARAVERLVTNGRDDGGLEPPEGSLRAAVSAAQPGDVIRFATPLTVLLEDDLNVATSNVRFEGPGQIRGKPFRLLPHSDTEEFELFNVSADAVTLNNLTFRNCSVNFGGTGSSVYLQGATVTNCLFTQQGALEFAQVENGRIEKNRFQHSYTLFVASITLDSTRSCVVFDNVIENAGEPLKTEAVFSFRDENVRIEKVVSNRGFFIQSQSGSVLNNDLRNSSLVIDLAEFNGTGMLVENNQARRLFAKGTNLTVRLNRIFPRGEKPIEKEIPGAKPVPKEDLGVGLRLDALNNHPGVPPGVLLVEMNTVTGGEVGIRLNAGVGLTQAVLHKNTVTDTEQDGIIINQTVPVTLTQNTLERCGGASIHLNGMSTPDVLVEGNIIKNSRRSGILIEGAPLVKNNMITEGVAKGLIVAREATPRIEGNTITQMGEGGVLVAAGANVTIDGITLQQNGRAGITVQTGATLTSTNATIEDNLGPGVVFRAQAQGSVTGGTIRNNKGAGVDLENDAMAEIRNVSFSGNKGPGIDLAPGGVTRNEKKKKANGDLDFPSDLTFDESARVIRGKAAAGAVVQLFKAEEGAQIGNKANGEGAVFIGETTSTTNGEFAIAPGPALEGDLFTLTATRPGAQSVTSEFSENIEVPPSPPVELVSVSSNEEIANDQSTVAGLNSASNRTLSANGRYVLFGSLASNLVTDDTNGLDDLFVRDRMNGTTERVNLSSAGEQISVRGSFSPHVHEGSISADGRFVAFTSDHGPLVPDSTSITRNVFLRDRQTNTTIAISRVEGRPPDTDPLADGNDSSISPDGSTVAFISTFDFVPGNSGNDLFVWRRLTGQFLLVNVPGDGGVNGTVPQFGTDPRLSGTGRYVAFATTRPLVKTDENGTSDVYLRDTEGGVTEIVSIDNSGQAVSGGDHCISPDGRYVAFATFASRDPGDTNNKPDIYLRDRQTKTLHWVSPPPAGGFPEPNLNQGCSEPSISADGRYVAFTASGNTTRPDSLTELVDDIFVYDRQLGKTVEVSRGAGGDARGSSGSPTLTDDGRTVSFATFGNLVPEDTNQAVDIFARDISRDFEE